MPDPVILELAVNGSTPRSRNRHVPRTPGEIAEVALAGVDLGASIIHNHNDEPMFTADGVHAVEPYLAAWQPVLERHPELLMYPTMAAGARGIAVERRWAHVEELARRGLGGMTLVDPGSVTFGLTSDGSIAEDARAGPTPTPCPTSATCSPAAPNSARRRAFRLEPGPDHADLAAQRSAACLRLGRARNPPRRSHPGRPRGLGWSGGAEQPGPAACPDRPG